MVRKFGYDHHRSEGYLGKFNLKSKVGKLVHSVASLRKGLLIILGDAAREALKKSGPRWSEMTTIRQLLDAKGSDVWAIDPDDSVFNAVTEMSRKDVGGLLVMEGENIVGIITERDYTRNVILKGRTSPETPVRDIMTADVICATPEQSVLDCLDIMTEKRVRHLPVMDNDQLVGMVSIGDLVKQIISDQKATIEELQNSGQT